MYLLIYDELMIDDYIQHIRGGDWKELHVCINGLRDRLSL